MIGGIRVVVGDEVPVPDRRDVLGGSRSA
jgi:hypothetical protein